MTKTTDPREATPWLAPFEAGRQWIELTNKAQTVLLGQLAKSAVPAPFLPGAVNQAFSQLFVSLLSDPAGVAKAQTDLWLRHASLWQDILTKTVREEGPKKDRRFKDEAWDKNLAFHVLKHQYLIGSEWLRQLVRGQEKLSPSTQKQVEFATERFIDAVAPTNFAISNPEALRRTVETGGANLVKGFSRLLDDLAADAGHVRRVDEGTFELGVNIATSEGSVVLRTDMMELIQYSPRTEKVTQKPLLLVPPWVNKFYMFDLQPKSSFIRWAVDQGFTVFAISWVNPDARHAQKDLENYWLEGPMAALEAIERATGETGVNLISYCLGGTLTAAGMAHLAVAGQAERVSSATLIATMTDFERFGDFEAFVTEDQVQALEKHLAHKGYIDSADLTRLFSLLRANDLIWSAGISSYLLAEDAVASDLLYWFADGIGMPGKTLTTFLRHIILDNALTKPGKLSIAESPITLKDVRTPLYFVSLRDDHVCAWQDTYKGAQQFEGETTFVLGGSGHNAGTISHPATNKHGYWTNPDLPPDPETWFKDARRHEGSWWPAWGAWLKERSGAEVDARVVGAGTLPALEPAPGSYARVRR
jgi:polyhydroxyalkanoate synthase subunit PhaC